MHNSSWPWRNSTFSKISNICWWGATTKNWKILANRKNNRWSLRIRQFRAKNFFGKNNFKIEVANVIFWSILNKSENIFWSIAQIERGILKLGHLVTKTVWFKSFESSRWPRKLTLKSKLKRACYQKFQISSDSKTVSIFGICITFWAKKSPTPFLKSSGLPRYNKLDQISWCKKIDNFKMCRF